MFFTKRAKCVSSYDGNMTVSYRIKMGRQKVVESCYSVCILLQYSTSQQYYSTWVLRSMHTTSQQSKATTFLLRSYCSYSTIEQYYAYYEYAHIIHNMLIQPVLQTIHTTSQQHEVKYYAAVACRLGRCVRDRREKQRRDERASARAAHVPSGYYQLVVGKPRF